MDRYCARRDKLRKDIRKAGAQGLLVTNYTNVTYLTGFTGDDSYLLVREKDELLITDPRYTTQLAEECPDLELHVRQPGVSMIDAVSSTLGDSKLKRLGVEGDSMSLSLRERIAEHVAAAEFITTGGLVEQLRMRKDRDEIEEIRKAVGYAERAFAVLRASIRPDHTEKELADALEHQMRLFGAKKASFDSIIAVGERAALPHARPTAKRVDDSTFVLVDWGASGQLYKSDLTRVLVTGKIPAKLERIYAIVLKAQLDAIDAIRPGVMCHDVDNVARTVIDQAGYGEYFGHGLGHGLGLDVHEAPRLARGIQQVLEPGMVVTVEPGIYLPGFGGVRIEDDVLVTKTGHEILTSVPKTWEQALVA